jgi:hypothetical protein
VWETKELKKRYGASRKENQPRQFWEEEPPHVRAALVSARQVNLGETHVGCSFHFNGMGRRELLRQ